VTDLTDQQLIEAILRGLKKNPERFASSAKSGKHRGMAVTQRTERRKPAKARIRRKK
jgi:hypothetical protein